MFRPRRGRRPAGLTVAGAAGTGTVSCMPPEMLSLFDDDPAVAPTTPAAVPPAYDGPAYTGPAQDSIPLPEEPEGYGDDQDGNVQVDVRDYDELPPATPPAAGQTTPRGGAATWTDPGPAPSAGATAIPAHILTGLNPEQATAASTLEGPVLVVAGPGSGKTRVLTHRIAALLAVGVPAWRVLAVTFTNKASKEMRERLDELVGTDAAEVWVSTFHSLCVRILRANHAAAGLERNFTIVDSDDAQRLAARAAERIGFGKLDRKELREITAEISRAKNQGKTVADLADAGDDAIAEMFSAYQTVLAESGGVDFDDLLLRTRDLLAAEPAIRRYYQRRFAYISIDEFQDTNPVQDQIVTSLAAEHRNLFIVGDADQAIYGFRSATPTIMSAFPDTWPNTTVVTLGRNYRSTGAILETVNAIIAENPSKLRAYLTTDNVDGNPVRLHIANDDRDEAAFVLDSIIASATPASDHAILVRTHAQTRVLEEHATRRALAYDIVGALKFYDRKEVRDALSWLKVAVNPRDTVSFARAAGAPKRGLGDKTLDALVRDSSVSGLPIVEHTRQIATTTAGVRGKNLTDFAALLAKTRAVAEASGPGAALEFIVDDTGLREMHAKDEMAETRLENLDEIVSAARRFTTDGAVTAEGVVVSSLAGLDATEAFLEHVTLVTADDADPAAAPTARLQIITAHASKGKEFPYVWVVGVEDGFYPHSRSTTVAEIAEERRLLFVAASRAESQLTLTLTRRRSTFGRDPESRTPSPFLSSLPEAVEQTEDEPSRRSGYGSRTNRGGYPRRSSSTRSAPSRPSAPVAVTSRPAVKRIAPKSAPPVFAPGAALVHKMFGPGTVVSVAGDAAEVVFPSVGTKTLDLRYAPVEAV